MRTLNPTFRIFKGEFGAVVRSARSPISFNLGFDSELRRGNGLPAQIRFIRSDPYAGFGIRL